MAKISELNEASNVSGVDLFHIVQGGVNKKVPFDTITQGFLSPDNNLSDVGDDVQARANLDVLSSAQTNAAIANAIANLISETNLLEWLMGLHIVTYPYNVGNSAGENGKTYHRIVHFSAYDIESTPGEAFLYSYTIPDPSNMSGKKMIIIFNRNEPDMGFWVADGTNPSSQSNYKFKYENNNNLWRGIRTGGEDDAYTDPNHDIQGGLLGDYLNTKPVMLLESDGAYWIVKDFLE